MAKRYEAWMRYGTLYMYILALVTTGSSVSLAEKPALKKITVLETNNTLPDLRYTYLDIPPLQAPAIKQLRDYVLKKGNFRSHAEPALFFHAMEWVCMQWKHHPTNEPPPGTSSYQILQNALKGSEYRCQEYGTVLNDILLSMGYTSRVLQLRADSVAYGGPGMGHVGVEVWSNSLSKWIYLDPQWCIGISHNNTPLNFREMEQLHTNGKFNEIQFNVPNQVLLREGKTVGDYLQEYKDFIQRYFGYELFLSMQNGDPIFLVLPLRAKEQYLTFQGIPVSSRVFTSNPNNFYFPVNQTAIIFNYSYQVAWSEVFQKYNIKTMQDYVDNMPYFAAKPMYSLKFKNSMPLFKHYEVKIGDEGSWKAVKGNTYDWKLHDGINTIYVRSVNQAGIAGPPVYAKINYSEESSVSQR